MYVVLLSAIYGLHTPILITEIKLLWYLYTSTFHVLAGFRNQESESLIQSFHPASHALWIWNGMPRTTVLDQWLRFLPPTLCCNSLIDVAAMLWMFHPFLPNASFFRHYGYGCTMRGHSTDWISGTADSPAPV